MADYFTQYSIGILATPGEVELIEQTYAFVQGHAVPLRDDLRQLVINEDPMDVPVITYDAPNLYIHDDEGHGEPWFLAQVLAHVFPRDAIDVPFANTCSKNRIDGFSGDTWHVRSGEVFSAKDVLRGLTNILRDARADADDPARGFLLGDVMNKAFERAESIL